MTPSDLSPCIERPDTQSATSDCLKNPIWFALTSEHRNLGESNTLAARYPAEISPLAAVKEQSQAAYDALGELVSPGESVFLFLDKPPTAMDGWQVKVTLTIDQMVCESFVPSDSANADIIDLSDHDVPDMLALTQLTEPGPFQPKTNRMGRYLGVRQAGQLAAMSGERLHLTGFTEVSAVCTHPDFRGHGYAKELVSTVCQGILARQETPILHVKSINPPAIRVYEKLGFRFSRLIHFTILTRLANQ